MVVSDDKCVRSYRQSTRTHAVIVTPTILDHEVSVGRGSTVSCWIRNLRSSSVVRESNYTKEMDQRYQEAIDAMNKIIGSGALGMPDYERGQTLLTNTYSASYEYTIPTDGWFYVRWRNSNADPTRITTVHVYSNNSKTLELTTITTSDGRRAGKDGGTTDQTIMIPVRKGYHTVSNYINYASFYPTFGQ